MKINLKNKKNIGVVLPYVGLILVVVFFAIATKGQSLSITNIQLIVGQLFTSLLCATGVIFVMSMGSLDFSVGSTMGICCFVATLLSTVNIPLAFLMSIICGMLVGFLNGVLVAKARVKSFVVTICIMFALRGLMQFLCQNYLPSVSYKILLMNNTLVKSLVTLAIIVVAGIVYTYTPFGRYIRVLGSGEIALRYSGVREKNIKIAAFIISGGMAGIAGIFSLLRTGSVIATTGNLMETDIMIALVLGGLPVTGGMKSRFSAAIIGTLLITVLGNGLVQLGAGTVVQQLIKGIVFLAVIIVTINRDEEVIK